MFDTTCADRRKLNEKVLAVRGYAGPVFSPLPEENVGEIEWQEHCVECGQPECFKTCKLFERSFDGKCRRFTSGIVPLKRGGFAAEFKQWGKLEGVFTGRVSKRGKSAAVDIALSSLARGLNRAMFFIPGRIGAITVYRRFKLWAEGLRRGDKNRAMKGLLARVWSDRDVRLHFVVIDGDHEIFSDAFELNRGWNEKRVSTPTLKRGARLLLFSTSDEGFTLVFNTLDVVAGNVSSDKPMPKSGEHAKFVKCVAWDLDNTIWKGILVEDGADQLVLNEEAARVVKELDQRGIVSTVVSKNDYEPAWKLLEKFGLAEYLVFPHINWLPKSGNFQSVGKMININLDTFAFIDDSSFERGEVGEKCPQVRIFKETEIGGLLGRPEFNPPISAESSGRRASYQREMQRVEAASSFEGDYQEFLKSCNIVLEYFDLKSADEAEYERCYELIQRSNQLTLTGNRYSQEAFKVLVSGSDIRAWGIKCHDKFGDYGIVGAVVVADEGEGVWRVKEFVMSCRVAKKGCEARAIGWVKATTGAQKLLADIVDTGRNAALKESFKDIQW